MVWTRNDDRMPFHRKWLGLSNDAYAMGHRAMVWSRSPEAHARPGFVTERELRKLSGGLSPRRFAKALQELVEAGAPAHEQGILDPVEGGFEIHDFEQYGAAPAREPSPSPAPDRPTKLNRQEAARVAGQASAAARRAATGTAQPLRTSSNVAPNVTERRSSNVVPNDKDQPTELLPVSPEPDPERPSPSVQDTEAVRVERRSVVVGIGFEDTNRPGPCPADLLERARGGGHLQLVAHELGVPIWDVEEETRRFVIYWITGRGMGGLKRDWLGELRQRLIDRHHDRKLLGIGESPGAIEHRERVARERSAEAAAERASLPVVHLHAPPRPPSRAEREATRQAATKAFRDYEATLAEQDAKAAGGSP